MAMATPAFLLREAYLLMRTQACHDVRRNAHVPPSLAGIVVSPFNPPELHIYALLDARLAPTQMRSLAMNDPAIYGFMFTTIGTTLHVLEDATEDDEPETHTALLCLWCTRYAAGGDSYRIHPAHPGNGTPGNILDAPQPLPSLLVDFYKAVFDPRATLPPSLAPTPQ